jgi:endonuclease/exonuclease/phosphatase family metal-dependent hydrolase
MKLVVIIVLIFSLLSNTKLNSANLRVLNYNIDIYVEWESKKNHIVKMFKEFNPDIILLQEIYESQAKELAEKLNFFWDQKAWHTYGITVLSKDKILQTLNIVVTDSENGAVAIKIQPDIWVVSLHLIDEEYKINDSERLRQLKFILEELDKLKANNIILGGDFNSLEDSILNELLMSKGFIDTHKDKQWARSTWIPAGGNERIDRIYIKGNFKIINGKTVDHNDIDWLCNIGWPTGDDHRLVMTDLSI